MTLANALTLIRLGAVPVVLGLFLAGWPGPALALLALALLTDFVDGRVARARNEITALGSLLDPVADKANVMVFFGYLYVLGSVPGWFLVLVLVRNVSQLLSIPVLKGWMKIDFKVKPAMTPRVATALGFFLLWMLLAATKASSLGWGEPPRWVGGIGTAMLGMSSLLEFYILVTYVPRFVRIARGTHDTFE